MNLGTMTVTLGVDLTQLDKTITGLNTLSQKFRTFGYLASAALTVPIIAAGKATFQLAKDYEYSMQKIVGLTGVAQSSVDAWSSDILKLGPQLGKAPQELAEALYFISSSGIKGAEAMRVLELSAKAASSGLGQTQQVADLLTSALNAYRGTGLTAAYATDVFVSAVREGKAEAAGFATSMGQIIPIAAQLSVPLDQVAGGMAAITLTGSSSANAAVYLKGVFNSLLTASTQGENALKKAGTSYKQLREILGGQGLIPLMQKLRDIQVKYGDELLSDVLPNIRALTGYLSLAGKNFQYNTELMDRVTNSTGSLGAAWAAVSNTIKIRFDQALSQAKVSMISLGQSIAEAVIPLLEKLVKTLESITKWFNSLSEEQKQNKLQWLAILAVAGPATLAFSLLGYTLSGLISTLKIVGSLWNVLTMRVVASTITLETFTTAASAAVVAAAPFALAIIAIGAATAIAWPAIQGLIDKIKALKKEIAEGQAALDFNDIGMQLTKSISKNMSVLSKLDANQLETTRGMISQRIALERDRLITAETTGRKEIEQEQFVLNEKKKILEEELRWESIKKKYEAGSVHDSDFTTWGANISLNIQKANKAIDEYIKNRQAEVDYDKLSAETVIEFYEKQGKAVDVLIKKHTDLAGAINKSTEEQIKGIERVKGFGKEYKFDVPSPEHTDTYKAFGIMGADQKKPGTLYSGKWLEEKAAIDQYNQSLQNQGRLIMGLANSFSEFFQNTGKGMQGMLDSLMKTMQDYLAKLAGLAIVAGILGLLFPASGVAVGALTNLRKFVGIPGFANGTNFASGGLSLVGERGPELVNLPTGAQVIPNHLLGAASNSGKERLIAEVGAETIKFILSRDGTYRASFA